MQCYLACVEVAYKYFCFQLLKLDGEKEWEKHIELLGFQCFSCYKSWPLKC